MAAVKSRWLQLESDNVQIHNLSHLLSQAHQACLQWPSTLPVCCTWSTTFTKEALCASKSASGNHDRICGMSSRPPAETPTASVWAVPGWVEPDARNRALCRGMEAAAGFRNCGHRPSTAFAANRRFYATLDWPSGERVSSVMPTDLVTYGVPYVGR